MHGALLDMGRFLESHRFKGKKRKDIDLQKGVYPFVTISRQVGAGGHQLAETFLQRLEMESEPLLKGWQMFDRELCERLVADPELRLSLESLLDEEYHSEIEDLVFTLLGRASPQAAVLKRLFETMRTLATFGKVVIVGRGGCCVTGSLAQGIHLRLVASESARLERLKKMKRHSISNAEARRLLHRMDADRAKLLKNHFHRDIDDPLLYDAVFNTDKVTFSDISICLVDLVKEKASSHAG